MLNKVKTLKDYRKVKHVSHYVATMFYQVTPGNVDIII